MEMFEETIAKDHSPNRKKNTFDLRFACSVVGKSKEGRSIQWWFVQW